MNKFTVQFIQFMGYCIVVAAVVYSNYFSEDTTVYGYIFHIPSLVLVGCGLFGFLLANNPFYQLVEIIRCLIKIQILSRELITTGVSSNFLCENKTNDTWSSDNIDYIEEEKQITLKILEIAGKLEKADS